jgi:hypothetical protein
MNVFALSLAVAECAAYHGNRHVVKMILETAQMLCSVFICTTPVDVPYKLTHKNHPWSVWARTSLQNYEWLLSLGFALCDEYTYRYGKTHASRTVLDHLKMLGDPLIPSIGLTPKPLAMPIEYHVKDPVQAYTLYYQQEKRHLFAWKKRAMPSTFKLPYLDDIRKLYTDAYATETVAPCKKRKRSAS